MIEINNLTTNLVDEKFLKKVAGKVLEEESASWRKKEAELSIALVGQGRIRELNKRYRGKNRATDVLVFPELKVVKAQKVQGLGEIIICFREVKKNAKKYKSSFEKELARVLIHGILHLLGYDHEKSKATALKMEEKQNYYLSKI
ncbi:MAG: rRNA maturation RNase YbeY [Candidatus Nealsonbacteria bacterium CG_4_9_14_0_2_um_filter_37_38]|uniref:Endoribonuclease YbeY n=1 Tax=Candidatus Nealsonbacteria bacterium CG_4_10_14_0_8_um_filter_37_14 TaxID=1974684 RepID=A0A2M7R6M3_9BACT|nr:MAG: rRNA maturation RNase YbeY [Candidatus Nealsonbacteria bacterium CG_4_8_14_3_um_filter_37_23]PIY89264.1 MAG: rRNA maturation RNase YbeY [Candidatus Nealsonbacteria bacterium CG_4_10_14_0_8_um_filter_37_14]PJC51675.1 MAG: rRNA maturation RNase YbeY [Candidatus Nealsonbacteria bacterium CG_4_9_14_0_2_um_filter_37_38]